MNNGIDTIDYFLSETFAAFTFLWVVSFLVLVTGVRGRIPALVIALVSSATLGGFAVVLYGICEKDACFSPVPIFVSALMGIATIAAFIRTQKKRRTDAPVTKS